MGRLFLFFAALVGCCGLKMSLKGPPAGVVDPPDKSSGDHNLEKPTGRAEKRNAAASTVHKYIYIYIYVEIFIYKSMGLCVFGNGSSQFTSLVINVLA